MRWSLGLRLGWVRVFGRGISWKDTRSYGLTFSERNGYTRHLKIGPWSIRTLRKPPAWVSTDPIPPEDIARAQEYVRERGWVTNDHLIPGPDPGACPKCGDWRIAGINHDCSAAAPAEPDVGGA